MHREGRCGRPGAHRGHTAPTSSVPSQRTAHADGSRSRPHGSTPVAMNRDCPARLAPGLAPAIYASSTVRYSDPGHAFGEEPAPKPLSSFLREELALPAYLAVGPLGSMVAEILATPGSYKVVNGSWAPRRWSVGATLQRSPPRFVRPSRRSTDGRGPPFSCCPLHVSGKHAKISQLLEVRREMAYLCKQS